MLWLVVLMAMFLTGCEVALGREQADDWARDEYQNWLDGDPYLKVWVNPAASAYYGPGDQAYGNTIPGFYVSQAEARDAGYRSNSRWNVVLDPFRKLNVGLGSPAQPLRTHRDLTPFSESTLSWVEGAGPIDVDASVTIGPGGRDAIAGQSLNGLLTLTFHNRSDWEIREATVWTEVAASQTRRTHRLRGQSLPKADTTFALVIPDSPPPGWAQMTRDADGNWTLPKPFFTWGFERVRGIPP